MAGFATLLLLGAGIEPHTDAVSPTASPRWMPSATAKQSCTHCHRFPERLSHPIHVAMPVRAPAELPAGPDGFVSCETCHDVSRIHAVGAAARDSLRLPPRELCRSCHAGQADPGTHLAHGLTLGRAHLVRDETRGMTAGVDRESLDCLGCHDGTVASAVSTNGGRIDLVNGMLRGSHPVGRRYPEGFDRDYRPRQSLPAEIRLPSGTVGCATCHSPYSPQEDMVTVSMSKSRLCVSCHVK